MTDTPDTSDNPHRSHTGPEQSLSLDALEREITTLSANINAATCRLLRLIAEFDEREGYAAWGMRSCAHWLNWQCGIALGAAREKVRVARSLAALPAVDAAFERGELSYSKVRAMTRIATPENEAELLMIARHGTAMHMEKLVRGYRRVARIAASEHAHRQYQERYLSYYHDDDGSLVLQARLPPETGAVVVNALKLAEEALKEEEQAAAGSASGQSKKVSAEMSAARNGPEEMPVAKNVSAETPVAGHAPAQAREAEAVRAPGARRADALGLLAETCLTQGIASLCAAERHQLIVHVDVASLGGDGEPRCCGVAQGPALAPETARRLGCDANLVRLLENSEGEPLSVGRKTRVVPAALKRALQSRDGGCRFPGCSAERFTDAHHLHHWADGGETRLDNLVLLCRHHHRLVHEGGYAVRVNTDGSLAFTRPDGRLLAEEPVPSPSTTDIIHTNRAAGLAITPETGIPLWQGEAMDYGLAIEGLIRRNPELFSDDNAYSCS